MLASEPEVAEMQHVLIICLFYRLQKLSFSVHGRMGPERTTFTQRTNRWFIPAWRVIRENELRTALSANSGDDQGSARVQSNAVPQSGEGPEWRSPHALTVNGSCWPWRVNTNVVNRKRAGITSGPIHTLLMVHFSQNEKRHPFNRQRISDHDRLKKQRPSR